jgi:hypothetical protein
MHDVSAAQLTKEQTPIENLRYQCADVLDSRQAGERRGRHRIDRYEPGLYLGIFAPCAQETLGLHGLAAKDAQRRSDKRDTKSRHSFDRIGFRSSQHRDGKVCAEKRRQNKRQMTRHHCHSNERSEKRI